MSVFNGMTAADFLSDHDTKVTYGLEITRTIMNNSKVKPFIATSQDDRSKIIYSTMKTSEVGEVVGIKLRDGLFGMGATGNVDFNASSEELKSIKQFIKIDRFQHRVPSTESIINQRKADSFKRWAKSELGEWATRKFDKIFFSLLTANCNNIIACGHHEDTDTSNIVKADILTTTDVDEAKRRALLGVDAAGEEVPPLMPLKVDQNANMGFYDQVKFFVMFVGTHTAENIKKDPNWSDARKDALERGKSNPIFTGALGFHNGVLLLDVETDTTRQSGIFTSKGKFHKFGGVTFDLSEYAGSGGQETEINLLVGAGAAQIVLDHGVQYYDYPDAADPRLMHAAIDRVYGMAKTRFKSSDNDGVLKDTIFDDKDYGVIAVVASTGK